MPSPEKAHRLCVGLCRPASPSQILSGSLCQSHTLKAFGIIPRIPFRRTVPTTPCSQFRRTDTTLPLSASEKIFTEKRHSRDGYDGYDGSSSWNAAMGGLGLAFGSHGSRLCSRVTSLLLFQYIHLITVGRLCGPHHFYVNI